MQLKRLKRGPGPVNLPAQHTWHMQQDSMASQLLAELENLTEAPTLMNECEGVNENLGVLALGTRTTATGRTNSSAKRQRRAQLVSVFGSQDENEGMQQQEQLMNSHDKDQDCVDVDLETLPWLQQSTPGPGNVNDGFVHASTANHLAGCNQFFTAMDREQAGKTKSQKVQQQNQSRLGGSLRCNEFVNAPQHQRDDMIAGVQQLQPGDGVLAGHKCAEEDAICDDSGDEFQQRLQPTATPQIAVLGRTGLRTPVRSPVEHTPRPKQHQQQQNHQQHMRHTRLPPSSQSAAKAHSTPLHLQRQQTQYGRQESASATANDVLQQPVSKQPPGLVCHEAEATAEADWMPPKYLKPPQQRPQQTQLPLSASKPLLHRFGNGSATASGAYSPAAAMGLGRPTAGGNVPSTAADAVDRAAAGASAHVPWWMILEDFVPVEVLVQEAVNPRDGSVVHVSYKSQFKDGTMANKRAHTATKPSTVSGSRKKKAARASSSVRAAAAAAAGSNNGFVTAGAYAAAGGSSGRDRKVKRGRRSGGSSGTAKGSGGRRKKKGGSSSGKWRYRGGRKVFIDGSGKQLTGSAAWGRYQQGKSKQ